MKKPVIAISPQSTPIPLGNFQIKLYSTMYDNADVFTARGALPVIPAFMTDEDAEEFMSHCDGLFLTGGADISPAIYGETKQDFCGAIQYDRDASDLALLKAATKLKKPVMGVCRGSQLMNAFFGGSLYQDLPTQHPSDIKHVDLEHITKAETHYIDIVKDSPLHKLLGENRIYVNSSHHQGYKTLGPDSVPMAYAPDGLVESFYLDDDSHWVRAYQWHPEMQDDNPVKDKLLKDFIDACRKNMEK